VRRIGEEDRGEGSGVVGGAAGGAAEKGTRTPVRGKAQERRRGRSGKASRGWGPGRSTLRMIPPLRSIARTRGGWPGASGPVALAPPPRGPTRAQSPIRSQSPDRRPITPRAISLACPGSRVRPGRGPRLLFPHSRPRHPRRSNRVFSADWAREDAADRAQPLPEPTSPRLHPGRGGWASPMYVPR
jgi:hypothetical protein